MTDGADVQVPQMLWINWAINVVSFHPEDGFELVKFQDREAMMQYVFQQTSNGFRLQ